MTLRTPLRRSIAALAWAFASLAASQAQATPLEEIGRKLAAVRTHGEVRVSMKLPLAADLLPVAADLRVRREGSDCLRKLTLTWRGANERRGGYARQRSSESSETGPCSLMASSLPEQADRQLGELRDYVLGGV